MRFFRTAEPPPASRVRLVWGDGSESVVELGPALVKGRVRVLDRPAAFNAVAVGAHGRTLVCATRTATRSLCADALWRLAHQGDVEGGITRRKLTRARSSPNGSW